MEEDAAGRPPASPPFWEPPVVRRRDFRLWVLVAFLVVIVSVVCLYLPPFFAFLARVFRPNHVRKSWDALNLFLVLFAIVCGFLGRSQGGNGGSGEVGYNASATPTAVGADHRGFGKSSTPRSESRPRSPGIEIPKWFRQYNYNAYGFNVVETTEETEESLGSGRLRRSCSSYPDLRQEEENWATENRLRFRDDTEVVTRQRSGHRRRQQGTHIKEVNDSKPTETPESIVSDTAGKTAPVPTTATLPEDGKATEDLPPKVPDVSPPQRKNRLRESSSYPDLRQEELRRSEAGRLSWDDSEVSSKKRSEHRRHRRRRSYGGDSIGDPAIFVDKHVLRQSGSSSVSPPTSSPHPPKPRSSHKFEALSRVAKSKSESYVREAKKKTPPPPPPPPPPRSDQKKSDKKRTRGPAKDIATALASFYNQKKLKKHKNRIANSSPISDEVTNTPSNPPQPPPPPPPPPPPTSVFQNWFSHKKLHKAKKSHHAKISSPPPPPPPPPPTRQLRNVAPRAELSRSQYFDHLVAEAYLSSGSQSRRAIPVSPPSPPPPPPRNALPRPQLSRSGHLDHLMAEGYVSSGGQSPLVPVVPPPPPPFKMKDVRLKPKGDFVRVRSLLGGEVSDSEAGNISDREFGEDRNASLFCPSPSVDTKADSFIARFRAGLRLEKLNSLREKEAGSGSVSS